MSSKQEKRARKAAKEAVAEYGMETQEIINIRHINSINDYRPNTSN